MYRTVGSGKRCTEGHLEIYGSPPTQTPAFAQASLCGVEPLGHGVIRSPGSTGGRSGSWFTWRGLGELGFRKKSGTEAPATIHWGSESIEWAMLSQAMIQLETC